jgi:predicted restriction endonuclease
MNKWQSAVVDGIRRLVRKKSSVIFTRQEIISEEINRISNDAEAEGKTPKQTLSRVLQELRDMGLIEFVDNQGKYIFLADPIQNEQHHLSNQAIEVAIKANKLKFQSVSTGETEQMIRQRRGQQRLRTLTLQNYEYQCALCDLKDENLLIAAHIARWADEPEARGDLSNLICLCRWHDPLLEYGLISLSDTLEILKKPANGIFLNTILNETSKYREPKYISVSKKYLNLHRRRTGFKN